MRILHLPFNVSSQMSVTVQALRELGHDARGLARQFSVFQDCANLATMDWSGKPRGAARLARGVCWRFRLMRAVAWAQVVHWHWGESTWKGLDLLWVRLLGRPAVVEFWGDDLRVPAIASRDNPYIARMYQLNSDLSQTPCARWLQSFQANRFACLIPGYELADYLDGRVVEGYFHTRVRVRLESYASRPPDANQHRPLVVHAPSDKARKGSDAVLAAVENLRTTIPFDFQLLHGLPRAQALKAVADCDVFLDQFTIGAEGLAAHEAMAFGKPVVCFIKQSIRGRYPADFPVVSATQESLPDVLSDLLSNGGRRHELGRRGRAYVEAHNDSRKVAGELVEIYEDLLARRTGREPMEYRTCRHWHKLPNSGVRRGDG
jgi:glycosyltransferase involved in cell wall biosynthesis